MFRLRPQAEAAMTPEALAVCDAFLRGLSPSLVAAVRSVVLFGAQARRFDAAAEFDVLVLSEAGSRELKTSVGIATEAAERAAALASDQCGLQVTIVSRFDEANASGAMNRLLANARREGIVLWSRE